MDIIYFSIKQPEGSISADYNTESEVEFSNVKT